MKGRIIPVGSFSSMLFVIYQKVLSDQTGPLLLRFSCSPKEKLGNFRIFAVDCRKGIKSKSANVLSANVQALIINLQNSFSDIIEDQKQIANLLNYRIFKVRRLFREIV